MNKTLKLWKALFGEDLTPGDCEIIGVEPDGTVIYYNATDGTCYNNGLTVDAVEDEEGKMNEREHIVTHPLQYVALLRMQLQACLTPEKSEGMKDGLGRQKTRLKEINTIAEQALSADPHKFVSNLKREAEFIRMKNTAVPLKKAKRVGPSLAMMTNEPHLIGRNGRIISRAEFEENAHILRDNKRSEVWIDGLPVTARKFCVLFGLNPSTRTWKYAVGVYCRSRKEAVTRAFTMIKLWALNHTKLPERCPNEYFDTDYNRKIPLSF